MKYFKLTFLICFVFLLIGCINHDIDIPNLDGYNNSKDIKDNVENIFGMSFPTNQDWCTTSNGAIKVYVNGNKNINKVQLLLSNITDSINTIKLLNQCNVKDGDVVSLSYDVPNNYDNLFVAFIDGQGKYIYKKFNIGDDDLYLENNVNQSSKRVLSQNYQIPSSIPIINESIESYANQRGWLPGELFYSFAITPIVANDYNDEFKDIFRGVLFNYFPNGRGYNNIKKIKDSGYFNESAYPITTGSEPIIISPIYKNDGGYYEICNAELYYYYFRGDLTTQEIEALPKYKAIDLSEVYSNETNDVIEKSKAYVLAYFGDNGNVIGTEGTYQFPEGYKIGFCYKSNTSVTKQSNKAVSNGDKRQGELYGDGRLNYNINKWKDFANSKLGTTDPRMGWVNINDKIFLCIESGTDSDINDLIIEVEGGLEVKNITPIEIEQQYYTFCFEDHRLGDYDMNDVVLKGTRIDNTHVEWTLMACGAMDHLYIYNIDGEHINYLNEVHSIFNKPIQFINTLKGDNTPYVTDIVTVDKSFSFLDTNKQPYIYDANQNWFVRISKRGEDPHAIMIPYDFRWPLEKICIKDAYLRFNEWGQGLIEGTKWYKYPEENLVY